MKIVTYTSLIFLFVIVCGFPARSQDKCDLQIKVYEFRENGDSESFPAKDYKIKLITADTKKSVKTRKIGEDVAVSGVNEESYIATISKDGFQKTEDKISLDCSLADMQNTATEIIFLWKGDSKKTFKTYSEKSYGTKGFVAKNPNSDNGVLNNGAITLGRPEYPRAARYVRASGAVNVQVLINELGYVVSSKAISGHPLLQSAAVEAAKKSKFKMTLLGGIPVKVNGIIVYNFVP